MSARARQTVRLAPGDIVEVTTPKGLAYVQVTHLHPAYPEVVRALPGLFDACPDLDALAREPARFVAMVPLEGAIGNGRDGLRKAGSAPVPEADREFPIFRMAIPDRKGGTAYWWFWDGEGLRYDMEPGPEAETMPLREVLGIAKLVARLAE